MEKKYTFYTVYQNNSGGYFIQDENVDRFVCVGAKNAKSAYNKLQKILENYREYCPCCGVRWNDDEILNPIFEENRGYKYPQIYGENYKIFSNDFFCRDSKIIIYYLNGKKEIYDLELNY